MLRKWIIISLSVVSNSLSLKARICLQYLYLFKREHKFLMLEVCCKFFMEFQTGINFNINKHQTLLQQIRQQKDFSDRFFAIKSDVFLAGRCFSSNKILSGAGASADFVWNFRLN
jgi:hypothetical protein